MTNGWTIYPPGFMSEPGSGRRKLDLFLPDAADKGDFGRDILRLRGMVLETIQIEPFRVEFWFYGDEFRIGLTMQTAFRCSLGGGASFDPQEETPDGSRAFFVGLRGKQCTAATSTPELLCVTFEAGETLEVEMVNAGVEPVHLIGVSNGPPKELLFFYVDPRS